MCVISRHKLLFWVATRIFPTFEKSFGLSTCLDSVLFPGTRVAAARAWADYPIMSAVSISFNRSMARGVICCERTGVSIDQSEMAMTPEHRLQHATEAGSTDLPGIPWPAPPSRTAGFTGHICSTLMGSATGYGTLKNDWKGGIRNERTALCVHDGLDRHYPATLHTACSSACFFLSGTRNRVRQLKPNCVDNEVKQIGSCIQQQCIVKT